MNDYLIWVKVCLHRKIKRTIFIRFKIKSFKILSMNQVFVHNFNCLLEN